MTMKIIEYGLPGLPDGDSRWDDYSGLQWRTATDFHGAPLHDYPGFRTSCVNRKKEYQKLGYESHVEVSRDHGVTWIVLDQ